MSKKPQPRCIIMAGGTGGHIFPGLAVAAELQLRGWDVEWMGNPEAMEGRIVPGTGIAMNPVVFAGFRGKGLLAALQLPWRLVRACYQAWRAFYQRRPAVVLGMGGYVALPGGFVAWLMNIPVVVHEQNAIAGLTNKLLARLASQVCVAFPDALPEAVCVGNPIRVNFTWQPAPASRYAGRQGPLRVLVMGGSLGAHALNRVLPQAIALLAESERPVVLHQSGERHLADLRQRYEWHHVQAECVAFIDDVAETMAQVDWVICRAGAMTVAEVAAIGVAALFVPYPHAVDDHQSWNARYLVHAGAAWLVEEKNLTPASLADCIRQATREQLELMAEQAKRCAKPEAAAELANSVEQAANIFMRSQD